MRCTLPPGKGPHYFQSGLWPTDVTGYGRHPVLLSGPLTMLYAHAPLSEITDERRLRESANRVIDVFDYPHKLAQDLRQLAEIRAAMND